jgi:putative colanic acid biosynthesis acetyltransferase WcaF
MWAWRCAVLRLFGARIGRAVQIHPTVRIDVPWNLQIGDNVGIGDSVILYSLGIISIGQNATISQNVHLCAGSHEFRCVDMPLLKLPISIGEDVWICADAFVGPNVTVGDAAVVGARAVVMRNVEPGRIMVGNPAKVVGYR